MARGARQARRGVAFALALESAWVAGLSGVTLAAMEQPAPEPPEPPTLVGRIAKVLTRFAEQQKPETQATIARALSRVNDFLSRLQKKK